MQSHCDLTLTATLCHIVWILQTIPDDKLITSAEAIMCSVLFSVDVS